MSMEGMFGQTKKAVSEVVGRVTWEAERQLRIKAKQSEIDQLQKQRNTITDELASITLRLYRQGSISNSQIATICIKIEQLDKDLNERLSHLNTIKSESFQGAEFAGPVAPDTVVPSTPSAPPIPTAPPAADQVHPPADQPVGKGASTSTCPSCGQPTRPGTLYCRNCGAKLS